MLSIQYSPAPERLEDCFALLDDSQSAFLCVADGCGGLGSRRYPELNNQTGASLAARRAGAKPKITPIRLAQRQAIPMAARE